MLAQLLGVNEELKIKRGRKGIMANLVHLGEFMTDAEEKAAYFLKEQLPAEWVVICNKTFVTPRGRSWEIDEVIVASHHVFVVEVKSIAGVVGGDEESWVLPNGESMRSPLTKVDQLARMVAGYLREGLPRTEEIATSFVTGVVILTGETDLRIRDRRRNMQVIRLEEAPNALAELEAERRVDFLIPHRNAILERLRALAPAPSLPRKINAYRVLERLENGPHYLAVLVEHEVGGPGSLRRLKMYRLSDWRSEEERRKQRDLIYRDWETLRQLENLPCVARAEPPFYWNNEQFLVVPYLLPPGRTLKALQSEGVFLSPVQAVRIASVILNRLAEIHAAGILHRNLSPNCIYVQEATSANPEVIFTDFDFARIPEAESIAEVVDPLGLEDSPYVAPECRQNLGQATQSSDVFAVGVILFELLSGQSAADFLRPDGSLNLPDRLLEDSDLPVEFVENLVLAIADMTDRDPQRRVGGTEAASEWLKKALAALVREEIKVPQRPLSPETSEIQVGALIDDRYRVQRILGSGATATTFLVEDEFAGGFYVLKKIHCPEWANQLAKNEWNVLVQMDPHPAIVRVYEVWPADRSYQLKMEYVEGPTLDEIRSEFPWPRERAVDLARQLLDALAHLERQGLYHRDISLRNVILGPSGPKLIDFGLAKLAGEAGTSSVGTLLFRAPEVDRNAGWHPTSDLFSAAVVLYWVFTGMAPFAHDSLPIDKSRVIWPSIEPSDPLGQPLRAVFSRALSPDPARRYQSAAELFEALASTVDITPIQEGERRINEWVEQVQSLYRNCRHGNAENRGLDSEFAEATYVPTRLDMQLLPAILHDRRFLAVFLTGNPGDGKTAFLERVRDKLYEAGGKQRYLSPNGWSYELDGHLFSANYDASESHRGRSSNEVLAELFEPLRGAEAPPDSLRLTILVAINDGRLRDFFYFNRDFAWLGSQLYRLLERAGSADPRILVVDLKERSLVDAVMEGVSPACLFENLLLVLLSEERWAVCADCRARQVCPMKFNVDTLRDSQNGRRVRARLKSLFQIVHARRRQHITIRDLRSALSYIVVGVQTCQEIHETLDQGEPPLDWADVLYFNAVFNPRGEPDELLEELALLDPALGSAPRLERFLHFHRHLREEEEVQRLLLMFPSRSSEAVRCVRYGAFGRKWYPQMKRRFLFEAGENEDLLAEQNLGGWQELLPYRHFPRYLGILRGEEDLTIVREDLCEGISRSDGIVDPTVYQGYLCIRTNHSDREELTVFKRFPIDHFRCRLINGTASQWVESLPLGLRLEWAEGGDPSLEIGLDLFEFLMRLREGYRPDAPEQRPLIVDLALFKTRLLRLETTELILMEAGRRLHRVTQEEGRIKREDMSLKPVAEEC